MEVEAAGRPRAAVVRRVDLPDVDIVGCHALTPDESLLALSPNSEEVVVLRLVGGEFRLVQRLSKHTQRVTGLAWTRGGMRLASCAEDRTAFVWDYDPGAGLWRPTVVELAAPRATLCVEWAPNGERFAVGLASRDVAICYYRPELQCWVAMKVGKSKASVVSVAWHASSNFIATGSPDGGCMVYDVSEESMLPQPRKPWGELQVGVQCDCWVNAVAFSPSGRFLAIVPHDSTVRVKNLRQGPAAAVEVVRWRGLPFLCGAFLPCDDALVACGFDGCPVLFRVLDGCWAVVGRVDAGPQSEPGLAPPGAFEAARSRFGGAGEGDAASRGGPVTTCAALLRVDGAERFTTSGADGVVLVWELLPG